MNIKDITKRFEELNNDGNIRCTEDELQDFLICGLIFKKGDGYVTRSNNNININTLNFKSHLFNINLQSIINTSYQLHKENKINRIYCMSTTSYNDYKEKGLIINKNNKDYYKFFTDELWLVNII